jgi:hypothetical protein
MDKFQDTFLVLQRIDGKREGCELKAKKTFCYEIQEGYQATSRGQ